MYVLRALDQRSFSFIAEKAVDEFLFCGARVYDFCPFANVRFCLPVPQFVRGILQDLRMHDEAAGFYEARAGGRD